MRKLIIHTLLYGILMQLITSCTGDDPRDEIFIDMPDLIEIRDHENLFTVGDTLWVISTTSRYLPMTEDAPYPLDVFETTGAESLQYALTFRVENEEGHYVHYPINEENVISQIGNSVYYPVHPSVIATLNEAQNTYESVTGIVLSETGAYTLNISELHTYFNTTTFSVCVTTNIQNANADNGYMFTVID